MRQTKRFILSCLTLLLCTIMYAQQAITGSVFDQTGEPVIGATIMEKGTSNGTITDFDGNFVLKVEAGKTLVVSYVGYTTQEVAAADGMKVTLKDDALALNEVVVTGYTTQRKADLTGAISTVSVSDLAKQNENNPIKAIQVLKDAASASIYGSRAANGVIIITTKGGKDGKVKVDFDASISVQNYVHKMEVLNAEQYGRVLWQAFVNDGKNPNMNPVGYRFDWGYDGQGYPTLYGQSMSKYLDAAGTTPASDTDWFDQTTRTGLVQQYNVSLSNGTERGSSFFSLGYYKNRGIIKESDFERFSGRMNTEYKLVKVGDRNIVTVGEHFTLNRTGEVQAPGGFLENVLQFNPSLPVYTTDGEFAGPVGNVATAENGVEGKQEHWTKWMWNLVATYNLERGLHRADFMLGTELNREDDMWFSGKKYDFILMNKNYMWPDAGVGEAEAYGSGEGYTLVSFFGKANYTYNDRYLASFTLRYDGSSRFGTHNRYGTFPSFSAGWRISEETFMKRFSWLDNLKWETTTQTNVGFDFGLLHNSLYGSFEWYFKKTKDILVEMPSIGVMGEGTTQWINAGEMENSGVELNIGYRGNIGHLKYDIAGNIGTYRNEITKLPETIIARGTFGGNGVESVVGHPMGAQVGYIYDGVFKSQDEIDNHATQQGAGLGRIRWKDLNGDGVINEKDQQWIYDPTPDFTWGLNIYLQYKNFDLTMFWQGVQGVDVISDLKKETDLWAGTNVANLNKGTRLLDAWTPVNASSNIPAASTMDNNNEVRVSSYYVENGSYAKLRTLQLGYNFPKSVCEKLYMQRLRMYLSAQNLLTIKSPKFTGVDPENANFGYPIPLNVTFGLNVSF